MRAVFPKIMESMYPRTPVFTTGEVAELAEIRVSNASRDLAALEEQGLVTKVRRGIWATTHHPAFSPYAIVPYLFREGERGYVSLLSALHLHGMIEQIPRRVQIVTTRQRPVLTTPVATFEFHSVQRELFDGFNLHPESGAFEIATPEKALFDTLYLSVRRGRRFSSLPEVTLPSAFSENRLMSWIESLEHSPLRIAVENRCSDLLGSIRT